MSVDLPPELRELKNTLTERFVAGIRKSFSPCPLIGPKWLQGFPKGNPADFRFFGVRKLAKALGKPADAIMAILMKNVSFEGLDIDVRLREGVFIDIYRKKGNTPAQPPVQKSPAGNPPAKAVLKKPPSKSKADTYPPKGKKFKPPHAKRNSGKKK